MTKVGIAEGVFTFVFLGTFSSDKGNPSMEILKECVVEIGSFKFTDKTSVSR